MINTLYNDNGAALRVSCDELGLTISKRIETGKVMFDMSPIFLWSDHEHELLDDIIEVLEKAKTEFKL